MVHLPTLLSLIGTAQAAGLLVLDQGDTVEEDRFQEELALSLADVEIEDAPSGFTGASMTEQLEAVRPRLEGEARGAVVWLGTHDPERLWVFVAFVAEDRAVIRMIDVERGAAAEAGLVLAVRELMTEAYATLPEAPELPPDVQVTQVVDLSEETDPAPSLGLDWAAGAVWPMNGAAGGLRAAGRVGLAVTPDNSIRFAGGLSAQVGGSGVRIGPTAGASIGRFGVRGSVERVVVESVPLWQPRVSLGVSQSLGDWFGAEFEVRLSPLRDQVLEGEIMRYDSGWVEFGISITGF